MVAGVRSSGSMVGVVVVALAPENGVGEAAGRLAEAA